MQQEPLPLNDELQLQFYVRVRITAPPKRLYDLLGELQALPSLLPRPFAEFTMPASRLKFLACRVAWTFSVLADGLEATPNTYPNNSQYQAVVSACEDRRCLEPLPQTGPGKPCFLATK